MSLSEVLMEIEKLDVKIADHMIVKSCYFGGVFRPCNSYVMSISEVDSLVRIYQSGTAYVVELPHYCLNRPYPPGFKKGALVGSCLVIYHLSDLLEEVKRLNNLSLM
jgi:hypothetical protein